MTTKGSTARNLHRLVSAVDFIKILMANLAKDPKMTLHNACYDAYNRCVVRSLKQTAGMWWVGGTRLAWVCATGHFACQMVRMWWVRIRWWSPH